MHSFPSNARNVGQLPTDAFCGAQLAYGTGTAWYKSGDESKIDQACIDSTKTAIKLGYYHLDGAEVYKTETELGQAIQESGVARDQLYIVTKVISNIADIPSALKASLKKLRTDHVDLYVLNLPLIVPTGDEDAMLRLKLAVISSTPRSSATT